MKKTVLRGEARVFGPECDSISISVSAGNSGQKWAQESVVQRSLGGGHESGLGEIPCRDLRAPQRL